MEKTIIYESQDSVARIWLNRPQAVNAFTHELVTNLSEALDQAASDPEVRVIVIGGKGEKGFSAGFDLKESVMKPKLTVDQRRADTQFELDTWMKIWDLYKPVIAQVHGNCLGGGLHLALMCDLIIASEDAKFGEPEIAFSYIPDILIDPWKAPMNVVREIMYLGETIDVNRAHQVGLVNKVVPRDKLEEETTRIARRLAKIPPSALRMLKYQINKTYEIQGFKNAMDLGAEMFNLCRLNETPDSAKFKEIVQTQGFKAALEWKSKNQNV